MSRCIEHAILEFDTSPDKSLFAQEELLEKIETDVRNSPLSTHAKIEADLVNAGVVQKKARAFMAEFQSNIKRRTLDEFRSEVKRAEPCDSDFLAECHRDGDTGRAMLFARIVQGDIVYDNTEGEWYFYNNFHWEPVGVKEMQQLASDATVSQYWALVEEKQKEANEIQAQINEAKSAGNPTGVLNAKLGLVNGEIGSIKKMAKSLHELKTKNAILTLSGSTLNIHLGIKGDEWDTNVNLLGVKNGVVDIAKGEMVLPLPEQYIRTVAPVDFDPKAKCDVWRKSLDEIFNSDTEMAEYIKRYLGYAMGGTCRESYFHVWHGAGRNGKEFLLNRVRKVLGPKLAGVTESELLLKAKNSGGANGATPAMMSLRGRRLAWASETEEGRAMNLARMKDLSGGHTLTGRNLHQRQQEWTRTHTLLLLTNHKPHVHSQSISEWDRLRLICFAISFVNNPQGPSEKKKNPMLETIIDNSELSGILNWLIEGNMEYNANGLQEPVSVTEATKQYRQDEDTLGQFIEECCITGSEYSVPHRELYARYVAWCQEEGNNKPMGSRTFGRKLDERGIVNTKGAKGKRNRSGIALLPDEESPL